MLASRKMVSVLVSLLTFDRDDGPVVETRLEDEVIHALEAQLSHARIARSYEGS
jgi:hypothetical protein